MSPLIPLALAWLATRKSPHKAKHKHKAKKPKEKAAPKWPTPAAPPPPAPPALPPLPIPPAPPAPPAHHDHPPVPSAHKPSVPARPKPRPRPQPAARPHPAARPLSPAGAHQGAAIVDVTVLSAQRKLNRLGARPRLKEDELFGPKTKRAWESAAKIRQLNPMFERLGPKLVRVSSLTNGALAKASGVSGDLYIP